jgi:2-oxoglutarate ferredoxin oxidoreductase subunit alpha
VANSLYLEAAQLEKLVKERFGRYEEIKRKHAEAEEYLLEGADVAVTAYGATARVVKAAVKAARAEGIKAGCIRPVTLWPFPEAVFKKAARTAKAFLAVEMSMGQMVEDVKLSTEFKRPVHFYGRTGGIIPEPEEVLAQIKKLAGGLD